MQFYQKACSLLKYVRILSLFCYRSPFIIIRNLIKCIDSNIICVTTNTRHMSTPNIEQQPPNYPKIRHASHTFSHSPSAPQIISYLCVAGEIAIYFTCLHRMYQNYVLLSIFSATCALLLISAVICSCSNPTDRIVYMYKWSKYVKNVKFAADFTQSYYCQYCDSFCALKSKHCRVCNRCTSDFDHHCIWINNCVGSNNYKSFFALILFTFFNFATFLVGGAIMSTRFQNNGQLAYAIPVWVMMGILSIMQIFLSQLIILHIYLQIRGISTYEFLQERRRKEEQQIQQQKQRKQRQKIQNERDEKLNQSQNSNSNIKVNTSNVVSVKPKIKLSEQKLEQKYQQLKKTGKQVMNENILDHLKVEEEDQEQMPQFLKKNKSWKIIFGSPDVEVPRKSSKKLNRVS